MLGRRSPTCAVRNVAVSRSVASVVYRPLDATFERTRGAGANIKGKQKADEGAGERSGAGLHQRDRAEAVGVSGCGRCSMMDKVRRRRRGMAASRNGQKHSERNGGKGTGGGGRV